MKFDIVGEKNNHFELIKNTSTAYLNGGGGFLKQEVTIDI